MTRVHPLLRPVFRPVLVAGLLLAAASPAFAQKYQYLGPNKCVNCHDHEDEKEWWEKKDGPPPNGHINALNQMENRKSADYAKAIGLEDPYDPKGDCVRCHATVFKGDANAGISCESCHGPGSGYLDVHQEKGAYAKAVAAGMTDVINKLPTWARDCMTCHVMDDARLVASGHPSGDDFDLGAKFGVVVHWTSKHDRAQVTAAGRTVRTAILAKRGGSPAPAPAAPAPAPAAAQAPAAPAPAPAPTPAPAPAPTPAPTPAPPPAATPAPAPTRAPAPAPRPRPSAPPPARLPPVAAPPPSAPVVAGPEATPLPAPEVAPAAPLPRSPAAAVAAVQGRAIALLDALLRRGARAPVRVTPPEARTVYRGADAELLRLQEEVLALALEALGTAPPAAAEQAEQK